MRRASPSGLDCPHGLGELGHPFGEQARVGRVGHIGRDDRGVGPHLVQSHDLGRLGLVEQASFNWSTAPSPTTGGDLHQRGWVRHGVGERDATEAPPGQRVGHLATERLEAEPVAKAQEHHAQVGLHRDRRAADHRVEERDERLEEDRIVEQAVDLLEPRWEGHELGRENCFPQGRLRVYLGAQHDGSVPPGRGCGAIVVSFGPQREHPVGADAEASDEFQTDFFRSKYLVVSERPQTARRRRGELTVVHLQLGLSSLAAGRPGSR